MSRIAHLQRSVEFNNWANQQAGNALAALDQPPPRAVRICAHIIGAERLWLSRLHREQAPEVWPELTASQCAAEATSVASDWTAYMAALDANRLDDSIDYVNSMGEPWSSTIVDILAHVTHHASYHRGQIAVLIAAAGHEPPYVDFIHATRQGLI